MQPFDYVSYQNKIIEQSLSLIGDGSDGRLIALMAELLPGLENELQHHLTAEDRRRVACFAGCGTCCMVNVSVLMPEAVNIVAYLRCNRSKEELRRLYDEMEIFVAAISDLDEEERIAMRRSCIFLDAVGRCTIYPVRPLLCRSITSTDAQVCRDSLTMQALGEEIPIMMNLFQKNLFDIAYQAVAKALTRRGLDAHGYEMTAAVMRCS